MCGLVGVAGHSLDMYHRQMFSLLLLFDHVRGTDSTGAAFVDDNKNIEVVKALGHPFNLFETKKYDTLISKMSNKVLLGHNRYKTIGAANLFNAHPFHYGSIVGAHNGTLTNWRSLDIDYSNINTDSQAIYTAVNKLGIEETLANIKGAYALTFYDQTNDSMHLIRNTERPLFYAYLDDRKTLVWASEEWMIWAAVDAVNSKAKRIALELTPFNSGAEGEEDTYIFSLPTDLLYTFKLPEAGKPFGKPVVKHMTGGSKIVESNFSNARGTYGGNLGGAATPRTACIPSNVPRVLTGWFSDLVEETRRELGLNVVPLVSPFAAQGVNKAAVNNDSNGKQIGEMEFNLDDPIPEFRSDSANANGSDSSELNGGKSEKVVEKSFLVDRVSITPSKLKKVLAEDCRWCGDTINFTTNFKVVSEDHAICIKCTRASTYVHPTDLRKSTKIVAK